MSTAIQTDLTLLQRTSSARESVISALATCSAWALVVIFIMMRNEYASFALAAVASALVWAFQRWSPSRFEMVLAALKTRSDLVASISILVLLSLPFLMQNNAYWIHILTMVFIFGFAAQGLNIHLGEIGAINVGFAGFFAFGA